jgi:hypothetical protein
LLTCEVEYISTCNAACQGLWLQSLLLETKIGVEEQIQLLVDNKSAINLARNPIARGRSKHIENKYHFLRDQVNKSKIILTCYKTDYQETNILTKLLKIKKFRETRKLLNVLSPENLN